MVWSAVGRGLVCSRTWSGDWVSVVGHGLGLQSDAVGLCSRTWSGLLAEGAALAQWVAVTVVLVGRYVRERGLGSSTPLTATDGIRTGADRALSPPLCCRRQRALTPLRHGAPANTARLRPAGSS